jgi:hypothetical protein
MEIIMAKPNLTSAATKRQYALAVLSGAMSRKDAYLRFIDANTLRPTQAAAQLHKTKQMRQIWDEVGREIESAQSIRRATVKNAETQLALADSLLATCSQKSEQEKLAVLRVMKSIQSNALDVLRRLEASFDEMATVTTKPTQENQKTFRRQAVMRQMIGCKVSQ